MTVCPACRWENDADAGTCAGCGRDLAAGAGQEPAPPPDWAASRPVAPPSTSVPEPRPYRDDGVPPTPPVAEDASPAVVHSMAEPVLIRPQTRPSPRTVEPSRDAPRTVDRPRAPRPVETARQAAPPVRDIPVVVAPTATRAAVRFRDNAVSADPDRPLTAPDRLPVGPGTRLCPSCGTVVEASRRFCRCGARLPATGVDRAGAEASAAEGWSTAAFRRAQRAANGGRRVRYDAPLAVRVYLVRTLAVVLLVLALASQAPPWGSQVRHWVQTRVEQAIPGH